MIDITHFGAKVSPFKSTLYARILIALCIICGIYLFAETQCRYERKGWAGSTDGPYKDTMLGGMAVFVVDVSGVVTTAVSWVIWCGTEIVSSRGGSLCDWLSRSWRRVEDDPDHNSKGDNYIRRVYLAS